MHKIPRMIRTWLSEPLLSPILMICMVIGIAMFVLLTIHVTYQLSWDEHFPNYKNTWRLQMRLQNEIDMSSPSMSIEVFKVMLNRLPQIKNFYTVDQIDFNLLFTHDDESIPLKNINFVSQNVPEWLDLKMVYGTRENCLEDSKSMLVSRSRALEIFGDTDPCGERLMLNVQSKQIHRYTIAGVYEDFPPNQHIQGDYFTWDYNNAIADSCTVMEDPSEFYSRSQVYVELEDGTDPKILVQTAADILAEYRDGIPDLDENTKVTFEAIRLDETHYNETYMKQYETFDKKELLKYGIVALAILMVLVTNSMILLTVRAMSRKKEIDIRRSMGAASGDIVRQFMLEHLFLYILMVLVAGFLIYLLLPYLNVFIPGYTLENIGWTKVLGVIAVGLVIAGMIIVLYPSMVARAILYKKRSSQHWKVAMLFQLTISLVLIITAMLLIRQIHLLDNKFPGFDAKNITSFHHLLNTGRYQDEILEQASKIPGVESASHSNFFPGKQIHESYLTIHSEKGTKKDRMCPFGLVGGEFFDMFHIPVIEGDTWHGSDSTGVVVNEAFMERYGHYGIELGTMIEIGMDAPNMFYFSGPLIGVVGDSYWEGLQNPVRPMVYKKMNFIESYFHFRLAPGAEAEARMQLWDIFKQNAKANIFFASMFDTDWEVTHQYDPERNFMRLMVFVATLGMLFTFIGIFGLTAYTLRQQTKNMAIRKVLGASPLDTVTYLLRSYVVLLGIALGISIPVAQYVLQRWLEGFNSRVSLTVLDFIVGLLVSFILILMAVLLHWLRLNRSNLIENLRTE